ncbi:hypothetical protein GCM10010387_53300 [Streptomyces inusitatus]|uniref:Histidine kinase/HSP90-like ATPase domain-containing protein n=1 Tax=Streptomyces inusitatus TaxID=68221 RepID=A0A918V0D6_9ACTN|nr:ATP-binding protein [Streptomyces inusitatus]GGZ52361.1 hypothetical protein GCM10010387_53300 [Streptomyces inusitatus]
MAMCGNGITDTRSRLRSALPFKAEPAGVSGLRLFARKQLHEWGIPEVSEKVQLAVTELATNVIKHVGLGTTAMLVMEPCDRSLRVELHDRSQSPPELSALEYGAEYGRGLYLLAGLASGWGTTVTAAGKSVWCEFDLRPEGPCQRSQRAMAVLESYRRASGGPGQAEVSHPSALENSTTGLISDLLHWAAARGSDPDAILKRAQMHCETGAA